MNDFWVNLLTAAVPMLLGGGVGSLVTLRYQRAQAANDATKGVQDIYQEIVDDLKRDRDFYKEQSEMLREEIASLTAKVDRLDQEVRENRQTLKDLQPNLCGRMNCGQRIYMSIYKRKKQQKNDNNSSDNQENRSERP